MDYIRFNTQNNEFIIELTKVKKSFSYSEFGKYECHIIFKNLLNQIVLDIKGTEKEIFDALYSFYQFDTNLGMEESDIVYFTNNGDLRNYFIYFSSLDLDSFPDNPTEDDFKLQISIYEDYMNQRVLRLYLETTYQFLEELIYNLYLLIEDVLNINELSSRYILDYMEEFGLF